MLDSAPALLTFADTDFLDRFLAGLDAHAAGEAHPFPELVPLRDWSEPPRATVAATGASLLPASVLRDPVHPEAAREPGSAVAPEQLLQAEEADTGTPWLRKLYPPVHRHFHLVAAEVVCDRGSTATGDRPPVDRKRVVEVGAVLRRLVADPTRERWEDWVVVDEGRGAWVELRTGSPPDPARPLAEPDLDVAARLRLGLGASDVLPPLAPVKLSELPPAQRNGRATWFAYLPVGSSDKELAPDASAPTVEQMRDEAAAALDARLGSDVTAVQERIRTAWRELCEALFDPWSANPSLGGGVDRDDLIRELREASATLSWADVASGLGVSQATAKSALRAHLTWLESTFWPLLSSDAHRLTAAVLLWVRAHRIELYEALQPDVPLDVEVPDPHAPAEKVTAITAGSLAGELDALRMIRSVPSRAAGHLAVHEAAFVLEEALADLDRAGAVGGSGWAAMVDVFAGKIRGNSGLTRDLGIELDAQPERGLLVLGALALVSRWHPTRTAVLDHYTDSDAEVMAAEARARQTVVRPRLDPDHVYAVQVFARIADPRPCHAERLVWSARTEPFTIADPLDLLGAKPVAMRLPDLPQLLRDVPRLARAGAVPMAAVTTPPNSGYIVGEEPEDTQRQWGIAWICAWGIPVFTIVAWIAFSIILNILLMLPGFAWMLLLKFCIPVPAPKEA